MNQNNRQVANGNEKSGSHLVLWRGILLPGHEACRLQQSGQNWHLDGVAVFIHEQRPCQLSYHITCDHHWQTRSAQVWGWVGDGLIDIHIRVDGQQRWWLNEVEQTRVAGSIDLDLNFSPSTNLLPIRRMKLQVWEEADITPAWLRFPGFSLEPLPQRYQRTGEISYHYESSGGKFVADLKVDGDGFVVDYPGIWVMEAYK
jgi:hypothetical protein